MKIVALSYLSFVPLFAFSQSPILTRKKFSMGISFEASYVNHMLNYDRSVKSTVDRFAVNEKGKIGGTIGFNLDYAITSTISVGTGLLIADRGYGTKKMPLIWASSQDFYPTHSKTVVTSYFVEIPLTFKYRVTIATARLYVIGGPSIGHMFYRKTTVFAYIGKARNKTVSNKIGDGYTNRMVSINMGIGADVPLFHRLNLCIEPVYRRSLTSLTQHPDAERYYQSIGLNTVIFFKLK